MAEEQSAFYKAFKKELLEPLKNYLLENKETVAVAESVTSGLLQVAFGTIKDASCFYQGGITAYNLGQKARHLLVEPIHAASCDCISQNVADEMAMQICTFFKSNWGLSITGYAAPVEKSSEIFAHCSIAYNTKIVLSEKIIPEQKEPSLVQLEYAQKLLQYLGNCMQRIQQNT